MQPLTLVVSLALLMVVVDSFKAMRTRHFLARSSSLRAANTPNIPLEVAQEIKKYLSERPESNFNGKMVSLDDQVTLAKEVAAPEGDIVPELQQTGWFRDPREQDEKKRFDKTVPLVSHPLSFRELEKYGYGDLVKPILELGGPYVVGSAIGYEWEDPTFELDESKRPERKESYAMDIETDLSVGGSFDEKLEKAAEMDLGKLKEELAAKKKADLEGIPYISPSMRKKTSGPMDYSTIKKAYRDPAKLKLKSEEKEDTVVTRLLQRSNIQAIVICGAFGFGRCTTEVASLFHLDDAALTAFSVANIALGLVVLLKNMSGVTPPKNSPSLDM